MIATLAVEEYVAGLIVAVMLTGGEALEAWAARRATRELDTLLNRAPVFAQRIDPRSGDTRHASVVVPPDLDQGVRHTCVKDAHQGPHSPAD
jgi:cation transport ATPase